MTAGSEGVVAAEPIDREFATQRLDRQASVVTGHHPALITAAMIRDGRFDGHEWVQEFARHRLADQRDERGGEQCERCQGNGEIVTDWDRYMRAHPGDVGDEAVTSCPDCDGEGKVPSPPADERGGELHPALAGALDITADKRSGDALRTVSRAIHEHLCRRDIMQYLDNDEDCEGIACAVLAALASPASGCRVGDRVLIWSGENHAYWRPNSAGYTTDGLAAGVYDRETAERIVRGCDPEKKASLRPIDPAWPFVSALLAAPPPQTGEGK